MTQSSSKMHSNNAGTGTNNTKPRATYDQLVTISDAQSGVLSRTQLNSVGWNDEAIAYAIRTRRLARLARGVFNTATGDPSWLAQAWAAHLKCGPDSYLTGYSALYLHGYGIQAHPIRIAIPSTGRRVATPLAEVVRHRKRRAITHRQTLPVARAAEALLDVVQHLTSPLEVRNLVADVYQNRVLALDDLSTILSQRNVRHRRVVSETLDHLKNGQTTALEIPGVKRIIKAHGLPAGRGQMTIDYGGQQQIVDYAFPEYSTIIEFDGRLGHDDATGSFRDMQRDNRAMLLGYRTLRFGMTDVNENACLAAIQVVQSLHLGGWLDFPNKCRSDCPVGLASFEV